MTGKRKAAISKKLKKTTTTVSKQSLKRLQHIKESDHAVTVPKLKKSIVAPNGKTFYPCQLCTKIFPKEATCRSHMERCSKKQYLQKELATNNKCSNENSETIQFPCRHCPKTFQKESTFVLHTVKCSNKDKLKVIDEESTKDKEDDFVQIKCDSKEENNEARQNQKHNNLKKFKPMRAPNGKLYYPCQYCNQIFVKELTYQNHLKKCPKKEILDMEVEKTDIVTSASHIEVEKTDPVTATSNPFDNLIACNYNVDRIFIKKYLKCKLCSFLAKKPLDLLKHRRTEHAVSKIIVPINEAEKYFDLPDRRRCPICKKRLVKKSKSSYISHLLVHTAGLIYACRICKKKFRRVDCLRDHEKRHVITFDQYQAIQNAFYEDDKD